MKIKKKLDPLVQAVTQEGATEPLFSSALLGIKDAGMYKCVVCGQGLFSSDTKFDSGTGWPSFTDPTNLEHIELIPDTSHGMRRTEVKCKNCGAHLGHVFDDGPADKGGKRYCINGCALAFEKGASDEKR